MTSTNCNSALGRPDSWQTYREGPLTVQGANQHHARQNQLRAGCESSSGTESSLHIAAPEGLGIEACHMLCMLDLASVILPCLCLLMIIMQGPNKIQL